MTATGYQVSSRKYRPQTFQHILGQESVVTVLKNALAFNRVAHAYIFSGIRGTGKTTLARLFAKALNCDQLSPDQEPCNHCASCKEISSGSSLDIIEIDGASHRGIEDIRQINETVLFIPSKARYKVYIIDEVHMLTKEAFNSLLKTLEEPPAHVKFFLATTELHKVPSTILSRCQKMHLKRIPEPVIIDKLSMIAQDHHLEASRESLHPIARAAQGSLRDAESLFDYILSLFPNSLSPDAVSQALGLVPQEILQNLTRAIHQQDYPGALLPITQLIDSGVAPVSFLHDLTLFFRNILLKQEDSSIKDLFSQEQLLEILDFLGESAKHIQQAFFEKTFLETVIIHLIQICSRPSLKTLLAQVQQPVQAISPFPSDIRPLTPPISEELPLRKPIPPKPIERKEPSLSWQESATIDSLLQFAAVEFSGVLTKE